MEISGDKNAAALSLLKTRGNMHKLALSPRETMDKAKRPGNMQQPHT